MLLAPLKGLHSFSKEWGMLFSKAFPSLPLDTGVDEYPQRFEPNTKRPHHIHEAPLYLHSCLRRAL